MYIGLGFNNVISIWIPFGDINIKNGSLIWSYNSNKCVKWKKYLKNINYGNPNKLNSDGTHSGWITDKLADYFNNDKINKELQNNNHPLLWCTTDFNVGDIAIFGLNLIHQTLRNDTNCFRISCDTRWQPQCQDIDPRVVKLGVAKQSDVTQN